jgi:hypothetical protein
MSTYSSNLKIELIGTGEQVGTWGTTTNSNFSNVFEQAIVGRGTVNFPTDANVTMTYTDSVASQLARNVYLNLTSSGSLSATRDLIVPTINKNYVIQNNTTGGQSIRVITAAGTGITVPNGFTCALYVNGTDVIQAFDFLPTLTIGALNVTTLDLTNLEVTNIKAKDGTESISLADSTGIASFSKATVISTTDNSNAALRITQLGTGNALLVEDSTNPDATPLVINSDGKLLLGHTASYASPLDRPISVAYGAGSGIGSYRFSADTIGTEIVLSKSRSGTIGTNTVVQNNDDIGYISFYGADGTGYISAAQIMAEVDGTPGTNDMPGRLVFSTTADGASSPTERMRIDNSGRVGIGSSSLAGYILRVGGNITGGTFARGIQYDGSVSSDVTNTAYAIRSTTGTAASAFTLTNLNHFYASQGTIGATSAVTNQYGFSAENSLTGATNNYGFYSNIASGTGRWNFYANGTALNYFRGFTSFGGDVETGVTGFNYPIQSHGSVSDIGIGLTSATDTTAAPNIRIGKSRGTSSARTIVQNNDEIGLLRFVGYDGTNWISSAQVSGFVDGTPGTSDMPGRIVFSTTADGASGLTQRTRISANGTLQHRNDFVTNNATVLTASYDSVSFSVAGQETAPHNISFSTDGTRMYILGDAGNDITQYTLTTAWDITTSGSPVTFSVNGQDSAPLGLYFRNNGLQFYVVGSTNDTVFEYACSTAWNITTASYSSKSFSVAGQELTPTGVFFKPDGKKMYVIGNTADAIFEYDLATAWDVSTSAYNNVSLSISGQETVASDLFFTNDGYKLFVIGSTGDDINEYVLSRPWDITTAEFLGSFSVAAQDNGPTGLFFKPDLSKFYVVGGTNDTVYQYSTGDSNIDLTAKTIDINGQVNVIGSMNLQDSSNLNFSGVGNRITGDFSSTGSSRLALQTSTVNGGSFPIIIPNGTATSGAIEVYNNSNPTNASFGQLSARSDQTSLRSGASGTGTYLPLTIFTNNTERLRIDTSGNVGIGTSSPSSKLDVAGDVYISSSGTTRSKWFSDGSLVYLTAESTIPFTIWSNSAERMRIDSSGNVGIGTSSPTARLDVTGSSFATANVNFAQRTDDTTVSTAVTWSSSNGNYMARNLGGALTFNSGNAIGSSAGTERMRIDSSGNVGIGTSSPTFTSGSGLQIERSGATATLEITRSDASIAGSLSLQGGSVQNNIYSVGAKPLVFYTNSTQAMRIASNGQVFVNATSTLGSAGARFNMLWNNVSEQAFTLKASSTTFNGGPFVFLNSVDGTSGTIGQTASSVSYNTSSDYRLKENITPMTGALAKVQALKPVTYTWKIDGANGQGFIAHELQEVVPECVTGEKDAINEDGSIKAQGVDTSFLVATLTAAIQEQQAIITDLKARIETLENK